MGKLLRSGVPDRTIAARKILQDWNTGRILAKVYSYLTTVFWCLYIIWINYRKQSNAFGFSSLSFYQLSTRADDLLSIYIPPCLNYPPEKLTSSLYLYNCSGKIKYFTHPPEQNSSEAYLGAEIVQQFATEFALEELDSQINLNHLPKLKPSDIVEVIYTRFFMLLLCKNVIHHHCNLFQWYMYDGCNRIPPTRYCTNLIYPL